MFTTFQEVEAFFDSRKSLGIKPGLDRMNNILQQLGNPQRNIQAVHIAGTNGKGSTAQYIKNALEANGYQVGVFSSPSLSGLTGHILLDGKEIGEEAFKDLCNEIYPVIKQMDAADLAPTEFEIITVIAFIYFARYSDIALIEAGMGGREDTTNCIQPILSIITNVAKDHIGFLGNTIAEIAYQKAGIIKSGVPVITGELVEEALPVINLEAEKRKTTVYRFGADFTFEKRNDNYMIWTNGQRKAVTKLRMLGKHQCKNASIAFMALEKLSDAGYAMSSKKAADGIGNTTLAGRFEMVSREPAIILDGAHNPDGINAFVNTVEEYYGEAENHILFAAFKDKELKKMLERMETSFSSITLTSFNHPRAADASELGDLVEYAENKKVAANWERAVDEILENKSGNHFITGSLNFISLVRTYILNKSAYTE
ncbi:bifunctional folylpolyglutamate synthase/dihydrofolate synthase [Oceanobacillus damuensis]|uniref:bifunctional folylpolyglutamate synthase/dihydrofolate synthase n=1 Tax=Oceanobacillus damuensis TaxID=937928 RepID=UPI000829E5E8|nr:folylpolyglutamate synthase/dihydrofolate synthase family protein [Oceanobacillus damuensis]